MRYDILCRVVDNYGDAAVCWRLASQLAAEHDGEVRLWIDRIEALHALRPEVDPALEVQLFEGVELRRWPERNARVAEAPGLEVVVEVFGCGLPEGWAEAMASSGGLWIVLEYLSAEDWVVTHHGLPSPHPRLPVQRHYFFPGVTDGTGGVLREAGYSARRAAFLNHGLTEFWHRLGFAAPAPDTVRVSLFGYENPALPHLLSAWAAGPEPVLAAVPAGRLRPQVEAFLGEQGLKDGRSARCGSLELRLLPFLPQPRYDELLWASDLNFVRGEDSFVRAQWAARPMVWQPYPQAESLHLTKLEAFMRAYSSGLSCAAAGALRELSTAWNDDSGSHAASMSAAWRDWLVHRTALASHAAVWAESLAGLGELAGNLASFCRERLK